MNRIGGPSGLVEIGVGIRGVLDGRFFRTLRIDGLNVVEPDRLVDRFGNGRVLVVGAGVAPRRRVGARTGIAAPESKLRARPPAPECRMGVSAVVRYRRVVPPGMVEPIGGVEAVGRVEAVGEVEAVGGVEAVGEVDVRGVDSGGFDVGRRRGGERVEPRRRLDLVAALVSRGHRHGAVRLHKWGEMLRDLDRSRVGVADDSLGREVVREVGVAAVPQHLGWVANYRGAPGGARVTSKLVEHVSERARGGHATTVGMHSIGRGGGDPPGVP